MNISLFLRLILDVKNAKMSGICPRVCSKKCWLQAANFHLPCLSQHYYIVFIFLENDSLPQRLCKMSIRGRNCLYMCLTRWIMIYIKILEILKKLIKLASCIVFKIFLLCWCLELTLKFFCH